MTRQLQSKLDSTRAFFNRRRPADRSVSLLQRHIFDAIAALIPKGHSDQLAIDLGCHWGRYTRVLAETFGRVIGVDYASNALETAERAPNIRYVELDLNKQASALIDLGPADLFLAVAIFEMVADPAKLCRAMWSGTKSRGHVLALIPNRRSLNYLSLRSYLWLARILRGSDRYIYNNGITLDELQRQLEAAGFATRSRGSVVGLPVYLLERAPEVLQRRLIAFDDQMTRMFGGSYHWVLAQK